MTGIRERRKDESSLIEDGFLGRQRFLKLGGAGLLAGLLAFLGAAGCGGGDNENDDGDGENRNGGNGDQTGMASEGRVTRWRS